MLLFRGTDQGVIVYIISTRNQMQLSQYAFQFYGWFSKKIILHGHIFHLLCKAKYFNVWLMYNQLTEQYLLPNGRANGSAIALKRVQIALLIYTTVL